MKTKLWSCSDCSRAFPADCFRSNSTRCKWCQFKEPAFRAEWRFKDKHKQNNWSADLTKEDFVGWYVAQRDECHYCRTPFSELSILRLKRFSGKYVSWDIDRIDSNKPYQIGNLALSCFICNTAKGYWFNEEQAKIVGMGVRSAMKNLLAAQK